MAHHLTESQQKEIETRLQDHDFVRLTFPDLNGLHLSKLMSTKHVKKIMSGQCEMYAGMITFGPRMEVVDVPEVVDRNHVNSHLIPDFETLHTCTWAGYQNREKLYQDCEHVPGQRVCAVVCDMRWPEGDLMPAHPRVAAKKLLAELREKHNLVLMSAFEPEFRAFKIQSMQPSCRNPHLPLDDESIPDPIPFTLGEDMYKTSLLAVYESFFMDLDMQMRQAGIDIQDCSNENSDGQLECPLMPTYGIQAADQYFTMKQASKEIGGKHDIGISYMTTPILKGQSSGCHFNHSLWRADGDKGNAMYDSKDPLHLSTIARHWIGGLLEHLPAMLAICSPTVNCYRRLHKCLAPHAVNWDIDNRFASIRVKNTDEKRTYVENRIPSSASCPYHVLAATVAAGMDGIERKLEPSPRGVNDVDGEETNTCKLLPNTFQEALELLSDDKPFINKLGPDFVDWFCQVKQRGDLYSLGKIDIKDCDPADLAFERHEYLHYL